MYAVELVDDFINSFVVWHSFVQDGVESFSFQCYCKGRALSGGV